MMLDTTPIPPRSPRPRGRLGLWLAVGLVLGASSAAKGEPPAWPDGRWQVVERGLGLPSRLAAIEFRTDRSGGTELVAFEADGPGRERVWSVSRLGQRSVGSDGTIQADWSEERVLVRLQVRPGSDGRLVAVQRERVRDGPAGTPERVRQAILAREPADERPVGGIVGAGTPRPGPSEWARDAAALYVVGADGSGLRIIAGPETFARAGHPAWSPDGRRIAFSAFDATGRDPLIRVVDASGGPTVAVAAGVAPSWSRDGSRLAYMASGKPDFATDWGSVGRNDERIESILLVGPGAGTAEVLARGIWPRWSPADDRLAFVARGAANWDIFVRGPDGARVDRVTDDPATDTDPSWTADGRSVVFLSNRGNRWDLYRVRVEGRPVPSRLTDHQRREDRASLSPDGRLVAFHDRPGRPDGRILILDLASGTARPLLNPPHGDRDPSWSPDGRSIAFVSRRPGPLLPISGGR